MRVTEHRPPNYSVIPESDPLILLAGDGTAQWQKQAIEVFQSLPDDDFILHIATAPAKAHTRLSEKDRQDWIDFHFARASQMLGGVLLWFGASAPKGSSTPIELAGEVFGMCRANEAPAAVVGIETARKDNVAYVRHRADQFDIPVVSRLDKACALIIEKVVEQL